MANDITALNAPVLTELAQSFENHQSNVGRFFPERKVPMSKVEIERIYGGVGMAPTVEPGKPDIMSGDELKVDKQTVNPVYSRESFPIETHIINNLRQPGTANESYGKRYVFDKMKMFVGRSDLLYDFLKCQMLLGGIDYTDPRTNVRSQVNAGIPISHIISDPPEIDWDDRNAAILNDIENYKSLIRDDGKVEATHIIMTSKRRGQLAVNNQVLSRAESFRDTGNVVFQEGNLKKVCGLEVVTQDTVYEGLSPATTPTATVTVSNVAEDGTLSLTIGGVSTGEYVAGSGDTAENVARNLTNFINGNSGMPVIASVAGPIITLTPKNIMTNQSIPITSSGTMTATTSGSPLTVVNTGLVKTVAKMIPDNKVIIVCKEHLGEVLGRTDYVIGEHPDGLPGIWSRSVNNNPPQAPGWLVQIGRAGLPYLRYPDWVVVATVKAAG